ncbi:MAG TPA: cell division protein FtsQ/DivIB, partial [Acetobacteraceae bacterium]|nr:cell division protein FtsQ/DivIB [Acetobacteraceae bacterium]
GIVSFAIVICALLVVRSAERGGWAARLQHSFARGIDLRVQQIVITGRANTPEPQLRAALGVSVGDPILGFSVSAARDRIESLASVEHVAVERRLPGTVFVDLVERRPFAIWQKDHKFVLIDRNGQVVDNESVDQFATLPLVVGAGAAAHAAELLDDLSKVPDIADRVAASVRVGERRWNLQLKNGIIVMLPEDHEDIALAKLHELQQNQALLDRPLVFVDLRLPDRLTVRPKPTSLVVPDAHLPDSANRRAT